MRGIFKILPFPFRRIDALAGGFKTSTTAQQALRDFETKRKSVIKDYQAAAHESMLWFENARDYMQLPPIELAYMLMTRSGRIDHETLRQRDSKFIAAYDARDAIT